MPTVLRERGYRIAIHTNDHPPPHVHVRIGVGVVKINLVTLEVDQVYGKSLKRADIRRAIASVANNRDTLLEGWNDIHDETT